MSSKKRFRDRTIFRADHLSYESDFHSSLGLCIKYLLAVFWSRIRTFLLEPEPVKKPRLRAIAVGLRGYVMAKLRQFLKF